MNILSIAAMAFLVICQGPTKKSAGVWPKDFAKGRILKPVAPPSPVVKLSPPSVGAPANNPHPTRHSNANSSDPNRLAVELAQHVDPNSPYQKLQVATQPFIEVGDWMHAEPALEAWMKVHPGDITMGVYLADAYLSQGRNDDALKLLESIAANAADDLKRESPSATQHFWCCASLAAALHGDVYDGEQEYLHKIFFDEGPVDERWQKLLPMGNDPKSLAVLSAFILLENCRESEELVYSRIGLEVDPGNPGLTVSYLPAVFGGQRGNVEARFKEAARAANAAMPRATVWGKRWEMDMDYYLRICAGHGYPYKGYEKTTRSHPRNSDEPEKS